MNTQLIQTLNSFDRFQDIIKEVDKLINEAVPYDTGLGTKQIALQVRDPDNVTEWDWQAACGHNVPTDKNKYQAEQEFKHYHPAILGTAIEQWLDSFNVPVRRARIMIMEPKSCYGIHSDPSYRIHLPLTTNKDSLFCFTEENIIKHIPATGHSYWIDTTKTHTAINCGNERRVHLMLSCDWRPQ